MRRREEQELPNNEASLRIQCRFSASPPGFLIATTQFVGVSFISSHGTKLEKFSASEPRPELLPTYSSGAAMVLAWPAVPAVAGYSLWAQWRVPEGEVIRTLELSASEPRVALPASPQPWHPLRSRK